MMDRAIIFIYRRKERLLFLKQFFFHVEYCHFFVVVVAANCLLSLSSKAYFYIKELFLSNSRSTFKRGCQLNGF